MKRKTVRNPWIAQEKAMPFWHKTICKIVTKAVAHNQVTGEDRVCNSLRDATFLARDLNAGRAS